MIYRKIGETLVPALGFGTFELTGEKGIQAILHALELGYRHLDTARMYGNEKEVGKSIQKSGLSRGDLFITSKAWSDRLRKQDLLDEIDRSLEALNTDYCDLYLIHWPNPQIPLEESFEALVAAQEAGKIKFIGVSNFPSNLLQRACELAPIKVNQVEYHVFLSQKKLLEKAVALDVCLTAYCPLAKGVAVDHKELSKIGEKYAKSSAQVALRWLLEQDRVMAIPRSENKDHISSNLDVFDFELSSEDKEEIEKLPKELRQINPSFAPNWDRQ
jgi:diketogulonate reductase-like aldo/keto reductase